MKPLISVQVCCYNSEKYLARTIESVAAQTFRDWELVVVNDGSTDSTDEIVKGFERKGLPLTYYRQDNRGFAAARNKALGLSKGKWIAILDHDDLWLPEKLEVQSASLSKYPAAKLHFSNSEWFTGDGEVLRNTVPAGKFASGIIKEPFFALLSEGCFIDSETAVADKETLQELGGFNEGYKYIVDYDMFLRLAGKHDVYYEDRVLARWRMHSAQATQMMEESMAKEYVAIMEQALEQADLPAAVKDKVMRSIIYHLHNYSLLRLKNDGAKAFLWTLLSGIKKHPWSPRTYLKTLHTFYRAYKGSLPEKV